MEDFLHQAERLETEYDWPGAVELYKQALNLLPEDNVLRKGEICERLSCALYRAAFQAENNDEFRQRLHQAIDSYEKAKEHYQKLDESMKTGKALRCEAMIAYIGYWLASEGPEKRRLINECWKLAKKSLETFERTRDVLEYGRTCNQLSSGIVFGFCLERDFHMRETLIREAVEHGEQSIKHLSISGDRIELARAYARTAFFLGVFDYAFLNLNEKERDIQRAQDYWMKSKEISEEIALFEFLHPIFGAQLSQWGEATDETFTNLKKALEYGRKTRDKFIIGSTLDWLAYHTAWTRWTIEDVEERSRIAKAVLQYAEDAKQQYSPISFVSPRDDAYGVELRYAEHYSWLAIEETDSRKKHIFLEEARKDVAEGLKQAQSAEYPEFIGYTHHLFSQVLARLAWIETDSEQKKKLLEEALEHRKESIRIAEQFWPFTYWDHGMQQSNLAGIKFQLANLTRDSQIKKSMLQEAILDSEKALKLAIKGTSIIGSPLGSFVRLGYLQYNIGVRLNRLHELTNDQENLRKAAKAFAEAAESYQKVNQRSRIAECYWKAAQAYDVLGEHLKAAENFNLASDNYKVASEKIPQLKDFYMDQALYMQAWTEIEKARYDHERKEYGTAKEHFEKATDIHNSLKKWKYLASNYSAWTEVEDAEDLSRREHCEEAIRAFEHAIGFFNETKKSIQTELSKIESPEEKQMAANMVKATHPRRKFCSGRIAIEEAKILDKKGDHYSSSQKYDLAAQTFEQIAQDSESEKDRREFNLIISLSRAWQKMMMAEGTASSTLYAEAAELFKQAKEYTVDQSSSLLALANSSFCKALEAGTEFEITRDTPMYLKAKKHMEVAATYYLKAGYKNASEYTRATELLFDAYMYMDNSKRETDPEKKAKLCTMTEKVLQVSAGSFLKAEHPEKREQALRLLEKVREERELAVSLAEVMHAPSIVSTTKALTAPNPTSEEAVGSERFEHADILANLIIRHRDLKVGEDLKLEIELVNAGRGSAVLIKLAEIIPEGFELVDEPEIYRVEDSCLNMKGKRLDPLKPEEIKITLRPKNQGVFQLEPEILYLDENGKFRSHKPEPATITVKELGIKGWIKGDR